MTDFTGHGAKLPLRAERAIEALLSCASVGEAAIAAGVSEKTLYRWQQNPAFQAELTTAKQKLLDGAVLRLRRAADGAVKTLTTIAGDEKVQASVRVSAAGRLLDCTLRFVEIVDLEERLSVLEKRFGGHHGPSRH